MEDEKIWETDVRTSPAAVVGRTLGRLPGLWSLGRKARRLATGLPDFREKVEVPRSDEIFSWIEALCETPHRRPGTAEAHRAERWVADRFREFGLENVSMDPVPITVWSADTWSLEVGGISFPSFYVPSTGFTGTEGVSGELVYVGTGRPDAMERAAVAGKIVVADVPFPRVPIGFVMRALRSRYYLSDPDRSISILSSRYLNFVRQNFIGGAVDADAAPESDVYWQAQRLGASGVCLILKDQPAGTNSHYGPYDGIMKPMPGLWIGKREGKELIRYAHAGAGGRLTLEGKAEPGVMHNVWGLLPGRSDEVIMITSHHDSPFKGAVEDGAGMAQVLAQARAWSAVPREKRPMSIAFVINSGHFYGCEGGLAFAREHPDLMDRARLLITLEHLGAKEVREADGEYVETGGLAFSVMFATPDLKTVALAVKALTSEPARVTALVPADLFTRLPVSDAAGFLKEAEIPVISWIGCPYYLLDEHDTIDKIQVDELGPIARTVTDLVKGRMALWLCDCVA